MIFAASLLSSTRRHSERSTVEWKNPVAQTQGGATGSPRLSLGMTWIAARAKSMLTFPRTRRAISSVVERLLHTQEVAGSNPASRTILHPRESAWVCPEPRLSCAAGRCGEMADATDLKSVGLKRPVPVRVRPSALLYRRTLSFRQTATLHLARSGPLFPHTGETGLLLLESSAVIKFSWVVKNYFLLGLLLVAAARSACAGAYQRTRDGKTLVWADDPKARYAATWSGGRDSEGYATGNGTLTWFAPERVPLTGTNIPSLRHARVIARTSGTMDHGKFVTEANANPKAQAQAQRRKNAEPDHAAASPAPKKSASRAARKTVATPSPSPTPTAPPSSSTAAPAATPTAPAATPAPTPTDESLNSLTHPPSSLRLNPAAEASPSPSPSPSAP